MCCMHSICQRTRTAGQSAGQSASQSARQSVSQSTTVLLLQCCANVEEVGPALKQNVSCLFGWYSIRQSTTVCTGHLASAVSDLIHRWRRRLGIVPVSCERLVLMGYWVDLHLQSLLRQHCASALWYVIIAASALRQRSVVCNPCCVSIAPAQCGM